MGFEQIAVCIAKSKIDLEREKCNRQKPSDDIEQFVRAKTFNPFIDTGQMCLRYDAKKLFRLPIFKRDLFVRMARFEYSTLFVLPPLQAS